jgi:hypothetical protein
MDPHLLFNYIVSVYFAADLILIWCSISVLARQVVILEHLGPPVCLPSVPRKYRNRRGEQQSAAGPTYTSAILARFKPSN